MTDNPTLQVTLINLQDVLKAVSDFCDQTQPFVGERFKKQLRNTIRAVPRSRAPVVVQKDDYVAWCRYTYDNEGCIRSIVTCDSDAPGAFKVYRAAPSPASSPVHTLLLNDGVAERSTIDAATSTPVEQEQK